MGVTPVTRPPRPTRRSRGPLEWTATYPDQTPSPKAVSLGGLPLNHANKNSSSNLARLLGRKQEVPFPHVEQVIPAVVLLHDAD